MIRLRTRSKASSREVHCHLLVRKVAIELAGELYDNMMMQDNTLYAQWKRVCPELTPALCEARFIELLWPKMIREARKALSMCLNTQMPEAQKAVIYDALINDATLVRGRMN